MKRLLLGVLVAMLAIGTTWIIGQEPSQTGRARRSDPNLRSSSEAVYRSGKSARSTSATPLSGLSTASTGSLLTETLSVDAQGRTVIGQIYDREAQLTEEQVEELRALREVVEELRNNEGKSEKEVADLRQQAKDILGKQIDRDVQQRQKKLADIERRATELRKQLEARQQNKEKTIEMLLMLAENPGAGLGIPNEWLQSLMQNQASGIYYFNASGSGAAFGGGEGSGTTSIGSSASPATSDFDRIGRE